ncbi:hypothetical protein KIW84_012400 [Lathyrus oleraceus]|uniref:DUF7745 domain-containing protein n=1 Tax=Pisum sativum TaxID=3888 RepID=A0A9D5GWJ1_PEA|nr:hypothetical protein KIW84_012400 [Pisum sativum]
MSLTNDDIVWYDSALVSLNIIDICGEFSNMPLIARGSVLSGGKDHKLLKSRMVRAWHNVNRKGRFELSSCNCVVCEAYAIWVKKRALELKILYACERPMSVVVVEPSTLPNQDVEDLEDTLAKMKQERYLWEERFHALNQKHEEFQLESKYKDALIEILEERAMKR